MEHVFQNIRRVWKMLAEKNILGWNFDVLAHMIDREWEWMLL